jgi:hypothetical protein
MSTDKIINKSVLLVTKKIYIALKIEKIIKIFKKAKA